MATQLLILSAKKQASSAQKLDCRMQQSCNRSPLTQPLKGDYYQALKRYFARCNRFAADRPWEIKAMVIVVLLRDV